MNVNLNITDTTFINGFAMMGGALYLSGASSVNINRCDFQNSFAFTSGGAIYLRAFTEFIIS